ncbi:SPX domain-containing protein 1-like isoform X2 [Nicotiana tabacum]|uniref:SPX domain-containing protein 1-like isoform X2 n=1 Tax=Nicotiana tabacum TaxID=4097 RepID=A0AC58SZ18_TOBAC
MKFGRILMMLMALIEQTLPEWKDKFLSYKDLKKQLKLIYPNNDGINRKEVNDFVVLLEEEIEKFNSFFIEKEEDYIIQFKVLRDSIAEIRSSEELMRIGRDLVDLHGQMVLLENYSALNYIGLVKILKKYDKRTGALIRLPVIQKVLEEPFFKTDVLNKLVKECETMLSSLFSQNEPSKALGDEESSGGSSSGVEDTKVVAETKEPSEGIDGGSRVAEDPEELAAIEKLSKAQGGEGSGGVKDPEELSAIENKGNMYLKLTKSALRVLQEIRSGSSTVSMFSLPPSRTHKYMT